MSEKTIDQMLAETGLLKEQISKETSSHISIEPQHKSSPLYEDSFYLSLTVICFGTFICICITLLIFFKHPAESVLRPFGTILVVIGALFLIVAGYSEQQISPVIGLLGTIVGYLLGKDSAKSMDESVEPKNSKIFDEKQDV